MKIIKKLSLVGIMMLLFALPAQAEVLQSFTDDFNHSMSTNTATINYPDATYPSDIFEQSSSYPNSSNSTLTNGAGADGSVALVYHLRGDERTLTTKELDFADSNILYEFSYDVKFSSNAYAIDLGGRGGQGWSVNPSFKLTAEGKIQTTSDGSTYENSTMAYSADTWYHVVVVAQGASRNSWIYDDNGNSAYSTLTHTGGRSLSALCLTSDTGSNVVTTIDNAKLVAYDTSLNKPDIIQTTVTDGEDAVPRNRTLIFEFDQKIAQDSVITLTKNGEIPAAVPVTVNVNRVKNTISVTYVGLLDRKAGYTLSFAGVTNGNLTVTDTITFETEDLHPWNDIVVSSAVTNGENTDITFTIGEEYNYPDFTGAVMAIVYEGEKMIKADMVALTAQAVGVVTKSFSLGTVPSGATITVILLDTNAHPIPLASGDLQN